MNEDVCTFCAQPYQGRSRGVLVGFILVGARNRLTGGPLHVIRRIPAGPCCAGPGGEPYFPQPWFALARAKRYVHTHGL